MAKKYRIYDNLFSILSGLVLLLSFAVGFFASPSFLKEGLLLPLSGAK